MVFHFFKMIFCFRRGLFSEFGVISGVSSVSFCLLFIGVLRFAIVF